MPIQPASGAAAAVVQSESDDQNRQPIIVTAPLFRDIQPERELDPDAIESYGVSTVDELLGEVQVELGEESEQPLIIVNGQRINDLSEIGAFPVEVLNSVQVLPRGSAVALGGRPGQRVISLSLKKQVRTATVTAAHKLSTDGNWNADRGEGILTWIKGNRRANLTLRARDEDSLLESERDIIQPIPRLPYALTGNVVGYPNSIGEIDPALSRLAGQIVTVVPVPASGVPTLEDFLAQANKPAVTDLGLYRTLRPSSRNYDLNGTFATPVTPWLTANATLRLNRNTSLFKRGLPGALFIVSPTNAFSPFANSIGIAAYGANPLLSRSRRTSGEGNLTLNAVWSSWNATWNTSHQRSRSVSDSQSAGSSTIQIDDQVNPFATNLTDFITLRNSRFLSRTRTTTSVLTANGPLASLPAGPLVATIEGRLVWDSVRSDSDFDGTETNRAFRRNQRSIRAALDVPLTSRENGALGAIGDLDANLEYGESHFSHVGSLDHYAAELTWQPIEPLRITGSIERNQEPADVQTLGDVVTVTPDVRTFDPLTGETVDVTQITGGNPNLLPQKTEIKRLSGLYKLVPKLNLQLNGEYTDTDRRNFVSSLPQASAAIALAFPDRYIRDVNGVLTTVDLRPVNFDSEHEKRLRWGFSMNTKIGADPLPVGPLAPGAKRVPRKPGTYFQLTANHTMVFSDQIIIRPGLNPVDLLSGGAIGIGGGRTRHQVDASAALTSGGTGARIGITWRGKSELQARFNGVTDTLRFSPVMLINVRAFTDMKRFFPHSDWAKSLRLSVDLLNLSNDRQEVYDSHRNTPLQYQPGYRDPVGRTIEFEIRKVF
jgi:hypothetical protein